MKPKVFFGNPPIVEVTESGFVLLEDTQAARMFLKLLRTCFNIRFKD